MYQDKFAVHHLGEDARAMKPSRFEARTRLGSAATARLHRLLEQDRKTFTGFDQVEIPQRSSLLRTEVCYPFGPTRETSDSEPSLPLHRPRAPEKHASPSPIRS
jgi:hypothetical protein